jgi:GntR family transcriptional regulator
MLITLDKRDTRPLYQQIVTQVLEQLQRGKLQQGDLLPSVRELARGLGINLHTVRSAYMKLRDQGIIELTPGRRARIVRRRRTPVSTTEAETAIARQLQELVASAFVLGLSAAKLHSMLDSHLTIVDTGGRRTDSVMKEKA